MTIRISNKALKWAKNASVRKAMRTIPNRKSDQSQIHTQIKEKRFRSGWLELGSKRVYFRSQWEANYGCFLEWKKLKGLIKQWDHEPKTFWFEGIKRGCVSYLPDFRVENNDGSIDWIEVKGYMDSKSKTKIARFRKYFPEENLLVITSSWFKENGKKLKSIVPGWKVG